MYAVMFFHPSLLSGTAVHGQCIMGNLKTLTPGPRTPTMDQDPPMNPSMDPPPSPPNKMKYKPGVSGVTVQVQWSSLE